MASKKDIFVNTLTSPYNPQRFLDFMREMISGMIIIQPDKEMSPYNTYSYYVPRYFNIGRFKDADGNDVGVFSVELAKGESVVRARTAQRTFVKSLLEDKNYAGALVAFYSEDNLEKWRFSFIRMDYEFSKGKITANLTPAKRYSYLVGKGEPCHTAMERLLPIFIDDDTENPSLDAIEEAFSVEAVTKQFFEAYKAKYIELYEHLENTEAFVEESIRRGFTTEQFTKKLLSQIVFLYFIQKKGWLGVSAVPKTLTEKEYKKAFFSRGPRSRELVGKVYYQDGEIYRLNTAALKSLSNQDEFDFSTCVKGQPWGTGPQNFMRVIFNDCVKREKNFFDDYLEPLFYTGLNCDRSEYNDFFPPLHCRIPFLNGGLFEELEHYEWKYNDFGIPNELFSNEAEKGRDADGILDIFDRYNFTMAEDEPMEKEVAVDPEMLGKVFENLLEVKDRKSKGAFYTPREIVHYMCAESLINYLSTKSGIEEEDIRKFITLGEFFKDEDARKTKYNHIEKRYEFDFEKKLEMPSSILDFKNGINRIVELDNLLSSVKVVDPAVGSGAFPLGLLNEIVKAREILTSYIAIGMSGFKKKLLYAQRSPYQLKTETIKNCIFACDIEPSATDITKLRLWLALVIEDEIVEDADELNTLGEHSKPRKLPNLDCNILCGNSLIDSFEGVKLVTENEALGNQKDMASIAITDLTVGDYIKRLIKTQDALYSASTREEKESLKYEIQKIYDSAICDQLENAGHSRLVDEYLKTHKHNSKPFILWQLYFPKVFKENGGFDICIGNPPYVNIVTLDAGYRDTLKECYTITKNKVDLYAYFIELGLSIINTTATLCFIIPQTWKATDSFSKLRELIFKNSQLKEIVNLENGTFEATVVPLIMLLSKAGEKTKYDIVIKNKDFKAIDTIQKDGISESNSFAIDTESSHRDKALFKQIEMNSLSLGTILQFTRGIKTSNDKRFIQKECKDTDYKKVYRGRNVKSYSLEWGGEYLWYRPDLMREKVGSVPHSKELFETHEKIVTQRICHMQLSATIDTEQQYFLDTCIVSKSDTLDDRFKLKYILALLNSKLLNYWYCFKYRMPTVGLYELHSIPIKLADKSIQNEVESLVDILLETNGGDDVARKRIDDIVYSLYSISDEDKDYINGCL